MSQSLSQQGTGFNQTYKRVENLYNVAGDLVIPPSAPKFVAPRRAREDDLISRHALFGGRLPELERLDSLLRESPRPFHFIHAPSGYGKSALLANWIRALQARGQPVCYHFVNRVLEGMADESSALRSLCEQFAACHRVVEELPASLDDLRAAYVALVTLPPPEAKPLVVILDGLDEAKGWSAGPQLFPASLPGGVHFFFSARADNESSRDEWLAQLEIPRDRVDIVRLDRLPPEAIAHLLESAGGNARAHAGNKAFVQTVFDVSKGDPFYLHFLVRDIRDGDLTPEKLARASEQPHDLNSYLDRWKKELSEDVNVRDEEVKSLLGLLTVALGPLRPSELSGASAQPTQRVLLEGELTGSLRRYLSGNRTDGYALSHPRFRDYLRGHFFIEREPDRVFRPQLLSYCRRWREHSAHYALNHLLNHLVDEKSYDELYGLIDTEWKEARARQTGSPRAFAEDVELAIGTALGQSPPDRQPAIRCCLVYATIMSGVGKVPIELLHALARLDRAPAALDYALLIRDPQRRSDAYVTIGRALELAGDKLKATEVLDLAFASSERIGEANARAGILLKVAEALHGLGARPALARILPVLEAIALDLADGAALDAIARFFDRAGSPKSAAEIADRAKVARQGETPPLDFSGIDFGFGRRSPDEVELDAAIVEAEAALKEGGRAEAFDALARARDKLSAPSAGGAAATYAGDRWLRLAAAFARADDIPDARKCAQRALRESREASAGSPFLLDSQALRMLRVAMALLDLDCVEPAEQAACDALACSIPSDLGLVIAELAKLANRLCDLSRFDAARRLAYRVVEVAESADAGAPPASLLAAFALAAAREGRVQDAQSLADRALAEAAAAGDTLDSARVIGTAAIARALIEPASTRDVERRLIDGLSGDNKAMGLACLARAFAHAGKADLAAGCADEVVELVGPIEYAMKAEIVLEAARAMNACGRNDRAGEIAEHALGSMGSMSISDRDKVLADIALILAQSQATEAASKHARDAFGRAVTYRISKDLIVACALHCTLGEQTRAHEMIGAAYAVLETMQRDAWDFADSFAHVALAAAKADDQRTLDRLGMDASARNLPDARTQLCCWSALAIALAERDRGRDAAHFAARARDLVLSLDAEDRDVRSHLGRLAEALARVGDGAGLKALRQWVAAAGKYRRHELLRALVPALALVPDKVAIEEIVGEALALRTPRREEAYGQAMLSADAASALFRIGEQDAGAKAAQEALSAFDDVRDGSVTPQVLSLLVPALVAARDSDGLRRLVGMPMTKWPKDREHAPGLRLLVPALATLGIDALPGAKDYLGRNEPRLSETLSDLAELQARRGEWDEAAATAGAIKHARNRAQAFFGIARALADRQLEREAREALDKAVANFPAILNDPVLLGRMAVLAREIGSPPRLQQGLKRASLSATQASFVTIVPEVFAAAVRSLCVMADDAGLQRAGDIVDAAGNSATRARCGASLALALAQAGRFDDATDRARRAAQAVGTLADVAQKAAPLTDLARALALCGPGKEAVGVLLQALNAARHVGRDAVFKVMQDGADVVYAAAPGDIAEFLRAADALWARPPSIGSDEIPLERAEVRKARTPFRQLSRAPPPKSST